LGGWKTKPTIENLDGKTKRITRQVKDVKSMWKHVKLAGRKTKIKPFMVGSKTTIHNINEM